MPIYEYHCKNCNEKFDQIHSFKDNPAPCNHCGSSDLKKILGTPAIRMEGRQSMSVRHTTTDTFGPSGKLGREEYFPEEKTRKAAEAKKKQEKKGATISAPPNVKIIPAK